MRISKLVDHINLNASEKLMRSQEFATDSQGANENIINRKINQFVQRKFSEKNDKYWDKIINKLDISFERFIITKRKRHKHGDNSSNVDWFRVKERWDLFIIVLAVLTSFLVPFELTFAKHWTDIVIYQVFSLMVDGFFFLDLICQFFTAYVDKKGKEIKRFSMISKNYILSFRFIVDSVSLIGVA